MKITFKEKVLRWLANGCEFSDAEPLLHEAIENTFYRDTLIKRGARKDNADVIRYELIRAAKLTKQEVKNIPATLRDIKPKNLPVKKVKEPETDEGRETAGKIRQMFPFLNETDCPDKFKILVADMISEYYRYTEGHKKLFDCKDTTECYDVAQAIVESYVANRECWEELKHYQKHRKILGNHKMFKVEKWEAEIKKMPTIELYEEMKHITNRIWRNKKSIQDEPESTYNEERRQRIEDYEIKKVMIEKQLGIK